MQEAVVPPHDIEAERALLGSVLLDPACLADIPALPARGDFYVHHHGLIWQTILGLHREGTPPDALLVNSALEKAGLVEASGGRGTVAALAAEVSSPAHARHFAEIVTDRAQARAMLHLAHEIQQRVRSGATGQEAIQSAQAGLWGLQTQATARGASHISDALWGVLGRLQADQGPEPGLVPTGFHALDDLLAGGFRPGEMVVVAGRASMGKTTFALNVAANAALAGRRVLIYSLEMTRESLAQNILAAFAGIPGDRLRKGRKVLREDGVERATEAAGRLGNLPIHLSDRTDLTVDIIRAEAMRHKVREGLDLLVVDYIGLIDPGEARGRSRQQDVGAISRGLKLLAKDLAIPIVVLAQVNRQAEQREGSRPRLADLREAGDIEQDADTVLLLYRPAYYSRDEAEREVAEVIVGKQRQGPTDTIRLRYLGDLLRFDNPTRDQ